MLLVGLPVMIEGVDIRTDYLGKTFDDGLKSWIDHEDHIRWQKVHITYPWKVMERGRER